MADKSDLLLEALRWIVQKNTNVAPVNVLRVAKEALEKYESWVAGDLAVARALAQNSVIRDVEAGEAKAMAAMKAATETDKMYQVWTQGLPVERMIAKSAFAARTIYADKHGIKYLVVMARLIGETATC